ncbi:MAG: aldo/keto reductase [Gemmatimonadetes bacterium]|nr:aldo/keto reductase [Gemmatimonadota bacterium]MBK7785752.1 aldo/keto reductase [Gemmatimonadota bacterium]MBK9067124.1 aldo/keto reductase [Gemmatimonadota bacterium]
MPYTPAPARYDTPAFYRRCGRSGVRLPVIALGLWHNFGAPDDPDTARAIIHRAFDLGITHFDLANNYGPPEGAAEETLGRILKEDLGRWRDELVISTKAGYYMWPGPYGEWGSRKSLLASLDQSLRRLRLDYVDIFYSHRFDPETPLEETMGALAHAVRSGKALYAGLSNYPPAETVRATALLRELGTPCLIHQPRYSLFDRQPEQGLFATLEREQIGAAVFSPLAKGLLTNRYFSGIPDDARARRDPRFLTPEQVTEAAVARARQLDAIARRRGQTLAQMALAWVLRHPIVTTAIIGASRVSQLEDCAGAARHLGFAAEELEEIETVLRG